MSTTFSSQLWDSYYTDALASLYNPFVLGLANGNLPKKSFVQYIQQDSFYLDVYEKAYMKAIELSIACGNKEFENCFSELIKGITEEKATHMKRALDRGEKIEQPEILRATKGYTQLLTKAYTEGTLGDIAAAICPCSKLYSFIGQEITKSIPDHNHEYSEWINVYTPTECNQNSRILDQIIDALVTDDNKESLRYYYSEAMRLEFEFFHQQSYVCAVPISCIMSVACGDVICSKKEIDCTHVYDGTVDKDGLIAFIMNEEKKNDHDDSFCEWDKILREKCVDYGKTVVDLESFTHSGDVTLAYGSFTQLPRMLSASISVLISPSVSEMTAIQSYGFKVCRLLTAGVYDLSSLPRDTVFYVDHLFEIGMMLIGTSFYPTQHFDTIPTALIIAGSDSGGGAGMQADMKACSALGVYTTTVFTAMTAQNTQWCKDVLVLPVEFIEKQIDEVMSDFRIDCVKTGMLGGVAVANLLIQKIDQYSIKNLVVDPCMICRSGHRIMDDLTIPIVKYQLIPKALIITPNLFEAETLLEYKIDRTEEGFIKACFDLQKLGCQNIYFKGGKVDDDDCVLDVFCYGTDGAYELFKASYVYTRNTHGTGCTLASSIAAGLAKGLDVVEAVREAKEYVNGAVIASRFLHVGKGKQGPVNHLYRVFPCKQHE